MIYGADLYGLFIYEIYTWLIYVVNIYVANLYVVDLGESYVLKLINTSIKVQESPILLKHQKIDECCERYLPCHLMMMFKRFYCKFPLIYMFVCSEPF